MRKIANKMRDEVEEAEENKVDVRKDDRTIKLFEIPFDSGQLLNLKIKKFLSIIILDLS